MPNTPNSYHDDIYNTACWAYLKPGQTYRLRVRIWERFQGANKPCQGVAVFTLGTHQQAFNASGGMEAAVKGIPFIISSASNSDIELEPGSQQAMHIELCLFAGNNTLVGEIYKKTVKKSDSSTVRLSLSYSVGE